MIARGLFIAMIFPALLRAAVDQSLCSYWLTALDDIAFWEKIRAEKVPVLDRENHLAAVDLDMDIGQKIRAVMQQIERESK